jgi:prepilin-type N-terminal cleavage/methylation domain-containing protein
MRYRNGFTLLELLVVVLLISAFVFIAVPKIKSGTEINIKSAATNLTATIRYLYSEAAFKKNIYRLVFDIDRDEYWVEVLDNNEYVVSNEYLNKKRTLPAGVHFKDVVTERTQSRSSLNSQKDFILFLPTGFVEPAVIHLVTDNENYYTLETKPYTGGTRVYDEYVELLNNDYTGNNR